jgi:hypothetical protein
MLNQAVQNENPITSSCPITRKSNWPTIEIPTKTIPKSKQFTSRESLITAQLQVEASIKEYQLLVKQKGN